MSIENSPNATPATDEMVAELSAYVETPITQALIARIDADAKVIAELRAQADADARYIASYRVDLEEARREIAELRAQSAYDRARIRILARKASIAVTRAEIDVEIHDLNIEEEYYRSMRSDRISDLERELAERDAVLGPKLSCGRYAAFATYRAAYQDEPPVLSCDCGDYGHEVTPEYTAWRAAGEKPMKTDAGQPDERCAKCGDTKDAEQHKSYCMGGTHRPYGIDGHHVYAPVPDVPPVASEDGKCPLCPHSSHEGMTCLSAQDGLTLACMCLSPIAPATKEINALRRAYAPMCCARLAHSMQTCNRWRDHPDWCLVCAECEHKEIVCRCPTPGVEEESDDEASPSIADSIVEASNQLHYTIEYLQSGAFTADEAARDVYEVRDTLNEIADRLRTVVAGRS